MIAVIKTGGKQYLVAPGDKIKVEKLSGEIGNRVTFDNILLLGETIGRPKVKGAKVEARILGQKRAKKVSIFKYKPKKRYHKKQGHRQFYTELEILSVGKDEKA